MRVLQVGAGMLGSIFAVELAKRLFAHGDNPPEWYIVDPDHIEARNCANQNFWPIEAGLSKAEKLAMMLEGEFDLINPEKDVPHEGIITGLVDRITQENIDSYTEGVDVLVDAVDNLPTRHLLWGQAIRLGVPLLHLGVSREGTGVVEWTLGPDRDTFTLSPLAAAAGVQDQSGVEEGPKLKPCQLLAHRRTGLLVGHAGAVAFGHMLGQDPEEQFPQQAGTPFYTTWHISSDGGVRLTHTFED